MKTDNLFANIKDINTIVLDVDGTILNSANQIQHGLPAILSMLIESGINIFIASARPISSISKLSAKLNLTNPIIGLNGSIVATANKIHWKSSLLITDSIRAVLTFYKNQVSINYYFDFNWIVNKYDNNIKHEALLSWVDPIIDHNYIPKELQKILIIGEPVLLHEISHNLSRLNLSCSLSKN